MQTEFPWRTYRFDVGVYYYCYYYVLGQPFNDFRCSTSLVLPLNPPHQNSTISLPSAALSELCHVG